MMIAAMTARVSSSSSSSIERAVALHEKLFIAYLVVLIVAAAVTVVFTFLVWRSGNTVQDAIQTDARVKIAASTALAESARKDAAEAIRDAAEANRGAAEAREETAKLALKVEEERRKRAEAEERLAELTGRLQSRHLNEAAFVGALSGKPSGIAACLFQNDDPEASDFAMDVYRALLSAGWTTAIPQPLSLLGDTGGLPAALAFGGATGGSGISLVAKSILNGPPEPHSMALRRAFEASGFRILAMIRNDELPEPIVRIIIGPKRP